MIHKDGEQLNKLRIDFSSLAMETQDIIIG